MDKLKWKAFSLVELYTEMFEIAPMLGKLQI